MKDKTLTEDEATAVVNAAIDLEARSSGHVTVGELEERAEGVGVPRARVGEALAAVERQKEEAAERERIRAAVWAERLGRVMNVAKGTARLGAVAAVLFGVYLGIAALAFEDAAFKYGEAQERVYSSLGRQQTVRLQVQGFTDPLNRDAEVAGAANRVYVAKADYDRAVSTYNARASGWASLLLRVFPRAYPARLPYAREVWH